MDTREIFERLDRVFQDVFDDDTIHVTPKTTADDIEIGTAWSTSR